MKFHLLKMNGGVVVQFISTLEPYGDRTGPGLGSKSIRPSIE